MDEALERHRIRTRMNGFPIFRDDEIVDVVSEPAWTWTALTDEQQADVKRATTELQAKAADMSWDQAYAFMLDEYGVACPHKWTNHEPTFRECVWCQRIEQLPGRVVWAGDRQLRVADPPPRRLRVVREMEPIAFRPDESLSPIADAPIIDEYEWTGTRYVVASR